MVTEIDHNDIKGQMVTILKANSSLYAESGAGGLIRLISVGMPDSSTGFDNVLPSMYITNANPLERIRESGSMTGSSESLPPLDHQVRYKIIFGVDEKNARLAEQQLDAFQKLTLETLEADHQLKNGGAAKVNGSRPELVETFRIANDNKPIQGRMITYLINQVTI